MKIEKKSPYGGNNLKIEIDKVIKYKLQILIKKCA